MNTTNMDECKVCANADNEYCFACENGNQFKPKTPADQIRDMTDDELAEFFWHRDIQLIGRLAEAAGFTYHYDEMKCKQNIKDWLKGLEG